MENIGERIADELFEKARRGNKESLHELENLGNNNDAEALSKLTEIYLKGLGGEKQLPQKAMEFLHRAAAQDYSPALYRLGDFYYYGKGGLVPDSQKAIEYLTRAAELGETEAYGLLGEIYLYSEGGIEADGYKVIDYMLKYAEAKQRQLPSAPDSFVESVLKEEIERSFNTAADIYLYGKCGVKQDGYKAIEIFAKAEAWFEIALIYHEGKAGIKQDFCKAIEYYTKIDDKSSIEELIEIMNGAEQLPQTADELDDEEDEPDYSELARTYKESIGVKQDGQKAIEYLIKDLEENDSWGTREEVRDIYLYGCGELKPDWRKAFEFMKVPLNGGLEIYSDVYFKFVCVFDDKLGYFRKDGLGTLQVLNDRANRLEKLKAPNIIMAYELERIAKLYEEGFGGLAPNREKAIEFYKKVDILHSDNVKIFKYKLAYLTGTDDE